MTAAVYFTVALQYQWEETTEALQVIFTHLLTCTSCFKVNLYVPCFVLYLPAPPQNTDHVKAGSFQNPRDGAANSQRIFFFK